MKKNNCYLNYGSVITTVYRLAYNLSYYNVYTQNAQTLQARTFPTGHDRRDVSFPCTAGETGVPSFRSKGKS